MKVYCLVSLLVVSPQASSMLRKVTHYPNYSTTLAGMKIMHRYGPRLIRENCKKGSASSPLINSYSPLEKVLTALKNNPKELLDILHTNKLCPVQATKITKELNTKKEELAHTLKSVEACIAFLNTQPHGQEHVVPFINQYNQVIEDAKKGDRRAQRVTAIFKAKD